MPSTKRTVALTGATGFVGRHVLEALIERGHTVRALVRDKDRIPRKPSGLEIVQGDLFKQTALDELCRGCDTVIHLVGIIMEKSDVGQTFERVHMVGTRNLLTAAKKADVGHWIHMSALGSRPDAVSTYHQTKWLAEESVRHSGLDYTIFRPSVIHGPDGEFMQMLRSFWCDLLPPFVPYFGTQMPLSDMAGAIRTSLWPFKPVGRVDDPLKYAHARAGLVQPVWVEDVAACFADAVTSDKARNEIYPLGGPQTYTWPQMYAAIGRHLPRVRAKYIVAFPLWKARFLASLPGMPFNRDQVIMSQEDSTCNIEKAETHFNRQLVPFEEKVAEYAPRMENR